MMSMMKIKSFDRVGWLDEGNPKTPTSPKPKTPNRPSAYIASRVNPSEAAAQWMYLLLTWKFDCKSTRVLPMLIEVGHVEGGWCLPHVT
jgi:hypothetical protein